MELSCDMRRMVRAIVIRTNHFGLSIECKRVFIYLFKYEHLDMNENENKTPHLIAFLSGSRKFP